MVNDDARTYALKLKELFELGGARRIELGRLIVLTPNFDPAPRKEEFAAQVRAKGQDILQHAYVTEHVRDYILGTLGQEYQMNMAPSLEYTLRLWGIDIEREEWGIFDVTKASDIERAMIDEALTNDLERMRAEHLLGVNVEEWKHTYEQMHGVQPG